MIRSWLGAAMRRRTIQPRSWLACVALWPNNTLAWETHMVGRYGPHNPDETYVPHKYAEQLFDTGEVLLNYVTAGEPSRPALLLIPGQTESWWGYEAAID